MPKNVSGPSALRDVGWYALARIVLVVGLTGVIYAIARAVGVDGFPIYIAAVFALVIAMPLGMWIFSPLRRKATSSLASFHERRRQDREQLQARLRGETPSETAPSPKPPAAQED